MSLFTDLGKLRKKIIRVLTKTTNTSQVAELVQLYEAAGVERDRIRRKALDEADDRYAKAIAGIEAGIAAADDAVDEIAGVSAAIRTIAKAIELATKVLLPL